MKYEKKMVSRIIIERNDGAALAVVSCDICFTRNSALLLINVCICFI